MKKSYIMMAALVMLSCSTYAQNGSRLMKVGNENVTYSFEYDKDGRLNKDVYQPRYTDDLNNLYSYSADKITQVSSYENSGDKDTRTAKIVNGRITEESIVLGLGADPYIYYFHYTYNASNQLVRVETSDNEGVKYGLYELTWDDGGPSQISMYKDGLLAGKIYITYDASVTNPFVVMMTNPLNKIISYEGVAPYANFLGNHYGAPVKFALSKMEFKARDENVFRWNAEDNYRLSYTKNAKGEIEGSTESGKRTVSFKYIWESPSTSIAVPSHGHTNAVTYYNMDGSRRKHLGKGLNIVRMADGTVRKILK